MTTWRCRVCLILWVTLTVAGCAGARATQAIDVAANMLEQATAAGENAAYDAASRRAHDNAIGRVREAVASTEPFTQAARERAFLGAVARNDLETATLLTHFWEPRPDSPVAYAAYLEVLSTTRQHARAQQAAWHAVVTDASQRGRWVRCWYATLAADPNRMPGPLEDVSAGPVFDTFNAFRGHSSIILRMERDGVPVGVFKPHQRLRHQSFRGEVAAYRLCALIHCPFTVPASQEAWVEASRFRSLTGAGPRDDLRFGTRRDLIFWEDDDGRDRLYGVAKAWVPAFERFPIEHIDVWEELVEIGVTSEALSDTSLRRALAGLDERPRGFYRQLIAMANDDLTAFDLAWQLSGLHVFDVLLNNFDRYQPEWFGMNAHWTPAGLLSIDNGASFSLPTEFSWSAARRRATRIEVFSRSMIDALRWMDDEAAFALLFPPHPMFDDEQARFDAFCERRAWLLDHVDALVDQHGEDAVYIFP